jgi:hypothetical protein
MGKNGSAPRVRLTEEDVSKPSSGEPEVESSDAGKEAADIHFTSFPRVALKTP